MRAHQPTVAALGTQVGVDPEAAAGDVHDLAGRGFEPSAGPVAHEHEVDVARVVQLAPPSLPMPITARPVGAGQPARRLDHVGGQVGQAADRPRPGRRCPRGRGRRCAGTPAASRPAAVDGGVVDRRAHGRGRPAPRASGGLVGEQPGQRAAGRQHRHQPRPAVGSSASQSSQLRGRPRRSWSMAAATRAGCGAPVDLGGQRRLGSGPHGSAWVTARPERQAVGQRPGCARRLGGWPVCASPWPSSTWWSATSTATSSRSSRP